MCPFGQVTTVHTRYNLLVVNDGVVMLLNNVVDFVVTDTITLYTLSTVPRIVQPV